MTFETFYITPIFNGKKLLTFEFQIGINRTMKLGRATPRSLSEFQIINNGKSTGV